METITLFDKLSLTSLNIISLCFLIIVFVVFLKRSKIKTVENHLFFVLIILALISPLFNTFATLLAFTNVSMLVLKIVNKIYIASMVLWILAMNLYTLVLTSKNNQGYVSYKDNPMKDYFKRIIKAFCILGLVCTLAVFILPVDIDIDKRWMALGPAVMLSFLIMGISIIIMLGIFIYNRKHIKRKQTAPYICFLVLLVLMGIIQYENSDVLLTGAVVCFVTTFMYFSLENPDLKVIEELNIAKRSAEKANSAKNEFIANMSNEIKTPLNAIVGFANALKDEEISDKASKEVDEIIASSNNLLDIVNDVLDISLIETDKLELNNNEYKLKELLNEMAKVLKNSAKAKNIESVINLSEDLPDVVIGDQIRVRQIIINILSNAVRFTKEGSIRFDVKSEIIDGKCNLLFEVEDTGIGIEKEEIDTIFNKFHRVANDTNVTGLGTGLGLSITKKLIEMMNGTINISSVYGQGTKVTFNVIQVASNKSATDEIIQSDQQYFDASRKKIAVVDDNMVNLKVAKRLLKDYNADPDLIESGEELIEKVKNGAQYDLIFLDEMMPKMSGTDTLRELKKEEYFHSVVVSLTANRTEGIKNDYLIAGFNNYLAKPIVKEELYIIMNQYLNDKKDKVVEQEH